jgi:hypothetical protein
VTAARVEDEPRTQVADLGAQMRIWGAIRDSISVLAQDLRPSLFPEAPVKRRHVSSRRCFLMAVAAVVRMWFGDVLMGQPSVRSRARLG